MVMSALAQVDQLVNLAKRSLSNSLKTTLKSCEDVNGNVIITFFIANTSSKDITIHPCSSCTKDGISYTTYVRDDCDTRYTAKTNGEKTLGDLCLGDERWSLTDSRIALTIPSKSKVKCSLDVYGVNANATTLDINIALSDQDLKSIKLKKVPITR